VSRSQVSKKKGEQFHEDANITGDSVRLSRASGNVQYCRTSSLFLTGLEVPTCILVLGLTTSLVKTFNSLDENCTESLRSEDCKMIHEARGGLRFSIATAVLACVDVAIGLFTLRKPILPDWLVLTIDSTTAGFFMGSGSVSIYLRSYQTLIMAD